MRDNLTPEGRKQCVGLNDLQFIELVKARCDNSIRNTAVGGWLAETLDRLKETFHLYECNRREFTLLEKDFDRLREWALATLQTGYIEGDEYEDNHEKLRPGLCFRQPTLERAEAKLKKILKSEESHE
jgi:hypothetical protein